MSQYVNAIYGETAQFLPFPGIALDPIMGAWLPTG